ncbi:MAG: hypothetical protein HY260_04275 [Chloroflexi bacterium]|nr:hypothetical protein [Chloroflexota bacterium]
MLHAIKVLDDCMKAHELLEEETDDTKFRILWVAGIALARAVGHVLDKVDSKQNDNAKRVISNAYENWKRDREGNKIFWEFIEDERNRGLKQYELGFLSGPIHVAASGQLFTLDENLFCPISDGAFAGEDCRDVLKEAIDWWERKLQAIETECERQE